MTAARMAFAAITLRPLLRIGRRFRAILRELAHPYSPEKHYMRGPGPKSRARGPDQGSAKPARIVP